MRINLNKKQKKILRRIIFGFAAFLVPVVFKLDGVVALSLYIVAYIVAGGDVLQKAGKNILRAQLLDENFLMCIATIGAFFVGEYPEGVMVMLLNQVGNLFESYAVGSSRKSIRSLVNICADTANAERDGKLITLDPSEVKIGEIIIVKPGEKIPLDGVITKGSASIDTSALTGESVPRNVMVGDEVLSGCINMSGVIEIRTTKEFGESTVSKIMELVENASAKKSPTEKFITRFAKYYTPCVVIAAIILAVIPPLLLRTYDFSYWIHQALIFLVVSCPCALVISVPLGFFAGIGVASREGILFKGSNYLEALSKVNTVIMDKTGTLTEGVFEITEILPVSISADELIEYTALAESYSTHPISESILKAYGKEIDHNRVADVKEMAGQGVCAKVDGKVVFAGNSKLMSDNNIEHTITDVFGTVVYIAIDGVYAGYILISDKIKKDAKSAISIMKKTGIEKTVMLSGDRGSAAEHCAKELDIDSVHSELLPADKVSYFEKYMKENRTRKKTAYVGDGINDAPVLAMADVGISMGGVGSDAAIEASDIVIIDDKPSKIPQAIKLSKKTMKIVKQNIVFSLTVKGIVMILAVFGMAGMYSAVFADVGVSVIAIANSIRLLSHKSK